MPRLFPAAVGAGLLAVTTAGFVTVVQTDRPERSVSAATSEPVTALPFTDTDTDTGAGEPADPPATTAPAPAPAEPAAPAPADPEPAAPEPAVVEPEVTAPASPAGMTAVPLTYVVQPGDTLFDIAAWFELNGFTELFEANRAVIGDNPDLIRPGQTFTILGGQLMQ